MKITDTHAHLYMKEFNEDIDFVIKKSLTKGINRFLIPSVETSDIPYILELEKKYPNICYPMIGLHPNKVSSKNLEKELNIIEKWLCKHSFISIGEIGMDFYLDNQFFSEQEHAFQTQIKFANKKQLPIVIHCRKAFNYILNILLKEKNSSLKGVFHCFSGTLEQAKKIIDLGIKIGIGGLITFKNNNISNFLHRISLDHLVLETDSPYLSPHPFRGKRNEPKNIRIILKKLSQIYSFSEEKIADIIHINVEKLFFS
ncbi:TatD family hydrolase [Blattabacterium cuenoti]|uniref:TatD family hydrolase n=1 Tax=Blattabacterium cuenoti TaxID=1653831 RepID=UPI00163BBACB|nr:TatD family hydrolase [Blattabacterium cuenoti]